MSKLSLLIFIVLVTQSLNLYAQNPTPLSPKQQEKIEKRWIWYQPSAEVLLKSGDTLIGQPIHFNMDEFFILPSEALPLGLEGRLKVIPSAEIERIWLSKGGRITAAQTGGIIIGIAAGTGLGALIGGPVGALIGGNVLGVSGGFAGKALHKSASNEEVWLTPSSLDYEKDLIKLRTWSVFEDSLLFTDDLKKLPAYSSAVRKAFPQKHFRISMGVNLGMRGFLEQNMRDVLEASGLPEWNESYSRMLGLEYVDFSWRVHPHWIVGGGLMTDLADLFSIYYYPDYSETATNVDYSYWMSLTDVRLYTEYVLKPVDHFFSRRSEFIFGGGAIISLAETSYSYSESNQVTAMYWNSSLHERHTVFGLQFRGAYHYYLARNFSLSGGLEVNLYQNLKLPGLELPEGYPGEVFGFADHTINYSTLRFKFGAHLYF